MIWSVQACCIETLLLSHYYFQWFSIISIAIKEIFKSKNKSHEKLYLKMKIRLKWFQSMFDSQFP